MVTSLSFAPPNWWDSSYSRETEHFWPWKVESIYVNISVNLHPTYPYSGLLPSKRKPKGTRIILFATQFRRDLNDYSLHKDFCWQKPRLLVHGPQLGTVPLMSCPPYQRWLPPPGHLNLIQWSNIHILNHLMVTLNLNVLRGQLESRSPSKEKWTSSYAQVYPIC